MNNKARSSWKNISTITLALTLLLLLTPLLYYPKFYYYFSNSKLYFFLALSELVVLFFCWGAYRYSSWRPRVNTLTILVLSFIGAQLLAGFFGVNPSYSFWGSIDRTMSGLVWLHLAAVFLVMTSLFRTPKDWKRVFLVSVVVATAVSIIFFLSLLFPEATALFAKSKGGSTLGNSSFLGTYLLFQIGFAFYLVFTSVKRQKILASVASIILVVALLLTTAQAAKLAFFGGVVLFFILLLVSNKGRHKKIIGATCLILLFVSFVYAWALLFQHDSGIHQWFVQRSGETRFVLWDMVWQGFKERPFLGWGPENFPDVFQKYYNPCLGSPACGGEVWFDRSHNKILDLLVDSGVIGLGLYVSLFGLAIANLWKAMKSTIISHSVFALFVSILIAHFVQNLTVFDTLTSNLFWLVLLGFISTMALSAQDEKDKRARQRRVGALIIAATCSLLIPFSFYWSVVVPVRGNLFTRGVVTATLLSERVSVYEKAVSVSRQGIDLRRSMLAAQTATFVLDLNNEQIASSPNLLRKEFRLSEQGLIRTIQQHPLFLRAYLDLGFLYQVWAARLDQEKLNAAEGILQDAVLRFPSNQLPYWALVGVYIDQGKNPEAVDLAKRVLALDPHVRSSQLRYLLTLKMVGQSDLSLNILENFSVEDSAIASIITPYLEADLTDERQRAGLLFRFYYDAAF